MTNPRWLLPPLLLAAGCLASDDDLSTTSSEIRGGIETTEPGVVGLWIGGGFCTASVISDDALITAAHCKSGTADPQMIAVVERQASGRYRCLTSTTSVVGGASDDMEDVRYMTGCEQWPARFRRQPSTGGSDDFMVMRLESGRWFGKREGGHVRVLASPRVGWTSGIHADTDPNEYIQYGASSQLMGSVRTRAGWFDVLADADLFISTATTPEQGPCAGDSGGPLGFHLTGATSQRFIVAGTAFGWTYADDGCASDDGFAELTRIAPSIPMIEELLGRSCTRTTVAGTDPAVTILDCDDTTACAGATPAVTDWHSHDADTVYADVDTAACGYTSTPLYFPTLLGTNFHWRAMGTTSVFVPTPTGFRVYVTDRAGPVDVAQAQSRGWRVGWQALVAGNNLGSCRGATPAGVTAWQVNPGTGGGIFVDVNTSSCGLSGVPAYITTLGGAAQHDQTTGVSSVYNATAAGFRIYLRRQDGGALTPVIANTNQWRINWLAGKQETTSEYCTGNTPTTGWTQVTGPGGTHGVTRTVDIASCGLTVAPRILASLGGTTMQWNTTGVTSLYNVTPTSFQVFIYDESGTVTPADATARGWHIDYAVRR